MLFVWHFVCDVEWLLAANPTVAQPMLCATNATNNEWKQKLMSSRLIYHLNSGHKLARFPTEIVNTIGIAMDSIGLELKWMLRKMKIKYLVDVDLIYSSLLEFYYIFLSKFWIYSSYRFAVRVWRPEIMIYVDIYYKNPFGRLCSHTLVLWART